MSEFVLFHKQFSSVEQEDTQEVFGALLNSLNEELNVAPKFQAVYMQYIPKDPFLV
jgi:hypothetical protein